MKKDIIITSLIFSISLILSAGILTVNNNYYPSVGPDWIFPFNKNHSEILCKNQFFSWWERSFGESHLRIGNFYLTCFVYYLTLIINQTTIILKIEIILFIFLSGFFTHILLKKMSFSDFSSFIGSFLYMSNSWIFLFIKNGWILEFLFSYSLVPLFILLILKSFEKKQVKYFIFSGLILGLICFQINYILLIFVLIIFIFLLKIKELKNRKKLFGLFTMFLTSLLILFPFLILPFFSFESSSSEFSRSAVYWKTFRNPTILESFNLFHSAYNQYQESIKKISPDLYNFVLLCYPILLITSIFFVDKTGDKYKLILFSIVFLLILIFFTKGSNPPYGWFYKKIVINFPYIFSFIRDSSYLNLINIFFHIFIICNFVDFLLSKKNVGYFRYFRYFRIGILFLVIFLIILTKISFLTSSYLNYLKPFDKDSYQDIYSFFIRDNYYSYKVQFIPDLQPIHIKDNNIAGRIFLSNGFPQHFIGDSVKNDFNKFFTFILRENSQNLGYLFRVFNIKYIVELKNFEFDFCKYNYKLCPVNFENKTEIMKNVLSNVNTSLTFENNEVKIYEFNDQTSQFWISNNYIKLKSNDFDSINKISTFLDENELSITDLPIIFSYSDNVVNNDNLIISENYDKNYEKAGFCHSLDLFLDPREGFASSSDVWAYNYYTSSLYPKENYLISNTNAEITFKCKFIKDSFVKLEFFNLDQNTHKEYNYSVNNLNSKINLKNYFRKSIILQFKNDTDLIIIINNSDNKMGLIKIPEILKLKQNNYEAILIDPKYEFENLEYEVYDFKDKNLISLVSRKFSENLVLDNSSIIYNLLNFDQDYNSNYKNNIKKIDEEDMTFKVEEGNYDLWARIYSKKILAKPSNYYLLESEIELINSTNFHVKIFQYDDKNRIIDEKGNLFNYESAEKSRSDAIYIPENPIKIGNHILKTNTSFLTSFKTKYITIEFWSGRELLNDEEIQFKNLNLFDINNYSEKQIFKENFTDNFNNIYIRYLDVLNNSLDFKTDSLEYNINISSENTKELKSLNLETNEFKDIEISSENEIILDFLILYNNQFKTKLNNSSKARILTSYDRINPTKYKLNVMTSKPFMLSFAESYDPLWVAKVKQPDGKWKEYQPVPLYSVINGFWIEDTGNLDIIIEYKPQRWFYYGLVISLTTLTACISYLIYGWKKDFFRRICWKVIDAIKDRRKFKYSYKG